MPDDLHVPCEIRCTFQNDRVLEAVRTTIGGRETEQRTVTSGASPFRPAVLSGGRCGKKSEKSNVSYHFMGSVFPSGSRLAQDRGLPSHGLANANPSPSYRPVAEITTLREAI